jgi:hypothetical protein
MGSSERDSQSQNKRALLIGVNHYYLDEAIGNLEFCVNDVSELDSILSDTLRGSFTTQLLRSGIDDRKQDPTRSNILSLVGLLSNNSETEDSILVYFAGHGFEQEGKNYLLPADARLNVLQDTAIPISWIKDTLSKSLARKKYLILDACHAGGRLGRANPHPMSRSFHDEVFGNSEGFAIMTSCQMNELSYDWAEKSHGVFSYYLLEGLRGAADSNKDGRITVPEINSYVYQKSREWALRNNVQQSPTVLYEVSGEFVLVNVPEEKTDRPAVESGEHVQDTVPYGDTNWINDTIQEASYMSWAEAYRSSLFSDMKSDFEEWKDSDYEIFISISKLFLSTFAKTRFSSRTAKEHLMDSAGYVIRFKEIKKWLNEMPDIKRFLISEFVTSRSFEYAGTMASIISDILPTFTEDELLEIISAIETNDQINSSFKARAYLRDIVDSAIILMPRDRYLKLTKLLNK